MQRSNSGPTSATIQFSPKNQGSPTEPVTTKNNKEGKKGEERS